MVRLRQTLLAVEEDPSVVADAIELRGHLEEPIALAATSHSSSADLAGFRRALAAMEVAADWEGFVRANWALHGRIAAVCPNGLTRAVYPGTLRVLTATGPSASGDSLDRDRYRAARQRVHVALIEAIAAGDEDAVGAAVVAHNRPAEAEGRL